MARIKIECFEKDKDEVIDAFRTYCPFAYENPKCNNYDCCDNCITENIEFVIKEEK